MLISQGGLHHGKSWPDPYVASPDHRFWVLVQLALWVWPTLTMACAWVRGVCGPRVGQDGAVPLPLLPALPPPPHTPHHSASWHCSKGVGWVGGWALQALMPCPPSRASQHIRLWPHGAPDMLREQGLCCAVKQICCAAISPMGHPTGGAMPGSGAPVPRPSTACSPPPKPSAP